MPEVDNVLNADNMQVDIELSPKDRQVKKIMEITKLLYNTYYAEDLVAATEITWERNAAISGILFTWFQYRRRLSNPNQTANHQRYATYAHKIGHKSLTGAELDTLIASRVTGLDITIMTPLICFLTTLPAALSEVTMGIHKFITKVGERKLADYGLQTNHCVLMHGAGFKPERKSGMIKSLGPLSLLVCLIHDPHYADKYKNGLRDSISHIHGHESIINYYSGNNKPSHDITKLFADILLLMSHKNTRRIYIPLLTPFCHLW